MGIGSRYAGREEVGFFELYRLIPASHILEFGLQLGALRAAPAPLAPPEAPLHRPYLNTVITALTSTPGMVPPTSDDPLLQSLHEMTSPLAPRHSIQACVSSLIPTTVGTATAALRALLQRVGEASPGSTKAISDRSVCRHCHKDSGPIAREVTAGPLTRPGWSCEDVVVQLGEAPQCSHCHYEDGAGDTSAEVQWPQTLAFFPAARGRPDWSRERFWSTPNGQTHYRVAALVTAIGSGARKGHTCCHVREYGSLFRCQDTSVRRFTSLVLADDETVEAVLLTQQPIKPGDATDTVVLTPGVSDALMSGAAYEAPVSLNRTDMKVVATLKGDRPTNHICLHPKLDRSQVECLFGPCAASRKSKEHDGHLNDATIAHYASILQEQYFPGARILTLPAKCWDDIHEDGVRFATGMRHAKKASTAAKPTRKTGWTFRTGTTKNLDIYGYDKVFIPVTWKVTGRPDEHLQVKDKKHHALIVVDNDLVHNRRNPKLEYYDSLPGSSRTDQSRGPCALRWAAGFLWQDFMAKRGKDKDGKMGPHAWPLINGYPPPFSTWPKIFHADDIPHQTNAYDSGLFVQQYMHYITAGLELTNNTEFGQSDSRAWRHRTLIEIARYKVVKRKGA